MKRKFWIISLLIIVVVVALNVAKPSREQNALLLMNVEALAAGEDYVPTQCLGRGSVDCPWGGKVKYVMIGYSLENFY